MPEILWADTDADVILGGWSSKDHFGNSVASAGDFNSDGIDDVIVGAPNDNFNSEEEDCLGGCNGAGRAFIFFGHVPAVKPEILQAHTDSDVILNGQNVGDAFGFPVASAGDFNGDEIDDVIVGANAADNAEGFATGRVFIFFGHVPAMANENLQDTDANIILDGLIAGEGFGVSVASSGDFNGDSIDDIIVGAYRARNTENNSVGGAFIYFGHAATAQQEILVWDTDADVIIHGQDWEDHFGLAVSSAGDFNGDGKDDVIVGAPRDDNNGEVDSGSAFIFFGGIAGTFRADADADVILDGQSAGDFFGRAVSSASDFNGDGKDDVIVGAQRDDNNGEANSGSAFIFSYTPFVGTTFYFDFDGDGFGDPAISIQASTAPQGYVANNTDCVDNDNTVFPGAPELCDNKDNDCDGQVDEGVTDMYYRDSDGDSYGDSGNVKNACVPPQGYVVNNSDCDDTNPAINPNATEVCDSVDNDCDGLVDEGFDVDGDGFTSCSGDCDDTNPAINPNATEVCDGVDNDCDGLVDEGFDVDGDGFTSCNGDCDDTNPAINPNAVEVCDGVDNDCDGLVDEGFDVDGDGFTSCNGDCDDTDNRRFPGGGIATSVSYTGNYVEQTGNITLSATLEDADLISIAGKNIVFDLVSGDGTSFATATVATNATGYADTTILSVPVGVYAVKVSFDGDDCLLADSLIEIALAVYDPSAGFVTGAGWIESPAGAYKDDLAVSGKAIFGFVSRYKKGATVPTGRTGFKFKAANLDFDSTEFEWLVVTGNGKAQFKGTGTINGAGSYKFMIWAGDGTPDTFRIRIWEEIGIIETDKYDNGTELPIGGGNIKVHSKLHL